MVSGTGREPLVFAGSIDSCVATLSRNWLKGPARGLTGVVGSGCCVYLETTIRVTALAMWVPGVVVFFTNATVTAL